MKDKNIKPIRKNILKMNGAFITEGNLIGIESFISLDSISGTITLSIKHFEDKEDKQICVYDIELTKKQKKDISKVLKIQIYNINEIKNEK